MYQPFKFVAKLRQIFETIQHFCKKKARFLAKPSILLIFLI